MKTETLHRLHRLRLDNDAARYAQEDMAPRFYALGNRGEDKTGPRAVSAFQLFQTPCLIAARLRPLLGDLTGKRVLDPSAGLGRLLDVLAGQGCAELVAVDIARPCCNELERRPGLSVHCRDFLACAPGELGGLFDGVIMNPPFHLRADIRHIRHALSFLKPGGRLVGICFHTQHRVQALRPLCDHWEILPRGSFAKEGTQVETVILSITKK